MHSLGGVGKTCFIFVIVTEFFIGLLYIYIITLVTPKLAKGVGMDDERIIKLSGQGSVYIRYLEPFGAI